MSKQKYGFELFEEFEQKKEIEEEMPILGDYIYGHLNYGINIKKLYGYAGYYTKCKIVLRWKKERGLELKTKVGKAICSAKLVNFFEDEVHTEKNCNCGSVYWYEIQKKMA